MGDNCQTCGHGRVKHQAGVCYGKNEFNGGKGFCRCPAFVPMAAREAAQAEEAPMTLTPEQRDALVRKIADGPLRWVSREYADWPHIRLNKANEIVGGIEPMLTDFLAARLAGRGPEAAQAEASDLRDLMIAYRTAWGGSMPKLWLDAFSALGIEAMDDIQAAFDLAQALAGRGHRE